MTSPAVAAGSVLDTAFDRPEKDESGADNGNAEKETNKPDGFAASLLHMLQQGIAGFGSETTRFVRKGKEYPDTKTISDATSGIRAQVTFLLQSNMEWKWLHDDVLVVIASGELYGSENHG